MAFKWAYNLHGGTPLIQEFVVYNAVVLSEGEFVSFTSGEVTTSATNDAAMVGATVAACDNTSDGESVRVIINPDAVYSVVDANARTVGDTLDLASGGLLVTTNSNADFIVMKTCTATEPTLVKVTVGNHWLD
jgi:hypothetical protein